MALQRGPHDRRRGVALPRIRALTEITPRETPLFRVLMALRAIPARLAGGHTSRSSLDRPLLDQFLDAGFAVLGVEPDSELVVGTISRFWELRGGTRAPFRGPEDFATFDTPGFAKAALDVLIEERDRGTLLRTETRVLATDEASQRAFGRYWALIRPGSGAIRREWLAAAKRRAESAGSAVTPRSGRAEGQGTLDRSMRDVIGQRRLLQRLASRALSGDVAHAYGLFGPRSVGKRTVALRLAQTLNCAAGVAGGCGTCLSCRKVERGIHPDVRLVARAADKKDIAIEQIREMQSDLALRPLEGRRRVVIVDDASELNQFGQDALLKTLEEPPRHAVLLIVTTTPSALHETIRSRVQPLPFRLVPAAELAAGLAARGIRDAERYAAAAAGRPGLAISLAAGDAARAERTRIEDELYRLVASGLTDRFAWAVDLNDLPDDAEHGRKRTAEITRRLDHWSELLRDAAVAARGELVRPLRPERARETRHLASSVSAKDLLGVSVLVERFRRDLDFTANARMMLELFALRLPYSASVKA